MNNKQSPEKPDDTKPPEHWSENLPWYLTCIIVLGCIVMAIVTFNMPSIK